jgi:hypothetical protein
MEITYDMQITFQAFFPKADLSTTTKKEEATTLHNTERKINTK